MRFKSRGNLEIPDHFHNTGELKRVVVCGQAQYTSYFSTYEQPNPKYKYPLEYGSIILTRRSLKPIEKQYFLKKKKLP